MYISQNFCDPATTRSIIEQNSEPGTFISTGWYTHIAPEFNQVYADHIAPHLSRLALTAAGLNPYVQQEGVFQVFEVDALWDDGHATLLLPVIDSQRLPYNVETTALGVFHTDFIQQTNDNLRRQGLDFCLTQL